MPTTYIKRYTREQIQSNPSVWYLFGDNDIRCGMGGQALAARGNKNAIGIRTKKLPGSSEEAYYSDRDYDENVRKIAEDFIPAFDAILRFENVVIPEDGMGTGFAELHARAPRTLIFINVLTLELVDLAKRLEVKYIGIFDNHSHG
jgi:hypothetical protein